MARALMLYETIDSHQIDDIMAGREPREPTDWGGGADSDSPGADTAKPRKDTGSPIGGPASEH
jgi:cell division protease FtsH